MTQPTFRLQRSVRADSIRPGAHLAIDDEIVVLDEVTIGREQITLACFPEGRTDGRRKLVHVGLLAEVTEVPSTDGQLSAALTELLDWHDAPEDDGALLVTLADWTVRIVGAPQRAPMAFYGLVNDELVVPVTANVDALRGATAGTPIFRGGIVDASGITLVGELA